MTRASWALFVLLYGLAAAAGDNVEQKQTDRTPLQTVVPQYPERAFRDRLEGEVQVCYLIDRRGRPFRIEIRSSTHRIFERPAIEAVSDSTWAPLVAGQDLPTIRFCRRFYFRLTPLQES